MAYTIPTAADLIAYYPAFADVPTVTIEAHITRASTRAVDTSWSEATYADAIIEYAAHTMTLANIGVQSEAATYARNGVTRIRSGNFDASFSDKAVASASGGGLDSTQYGRAYKMLLRRNKGGPRVVLAPGGCDDSWGATGITNDGTLLP